MASLQTDFFGNIQEEFKAYLKAPVGSFYCTPGSRIMIYAVIFILTGLGAFTALSLHIGLMHTGAYPPITIFDDINDLIATLLKFGGINAWLTGALFTLCAISVDVLIAILIRPWGAYHRRTVGKTWLIFLGVYLVGFLIDRAFGYKLIGLYEPALLFLWEADPSQRPGMLPAILFTLPFWLIIVAIVMRIITRKQAQTEELLRVRIEAILEERAQSADICPKSADGADHNKPIGIDNPLQLPTDSGIGPIHPSDIGHVTAEDHYLRIFFHDGDKLKDILVRMPLKTLLAQLPKVCFAQIHRSHLVNLERISGLKRYGQSVRLSMKCGDFELPVSRYRLPQLLPLLDRFLKN